MAELRTRSGARLEFDRTSVTLRTRHHATIVPLDQVDHIFGGRQAGSPLLLAGALLGVLVAVVGYYATLVLESLLGWALVAAGLLAAAVLLVPYLPRHQVRVASRGARLQVALAGKQATDAAAFLAELVAARTAFLEGVYQEEAA